MDRYIIERAGAPVAWFDADSIAEIFEARTPDVYASVRLYRLHSNAWVREEDPPAGRTYLQVEERSAALWLIVQGYGDAADALLPAAVLKSKM